MKVAVVVGNPRANSRTLTVARAMAERVGTRGDGEVTVELDLARFARRIFDWPDEELADLNATVAAANVLVIARPTYLGLLRAFLDRCPHNGLAGVTAIPVMTRGSLLHGMAIELSLRRVLVELEAAVPTRGLFS